MNLITHLIQKDPTLTLDDFIQNLNNSISQKCDEALRQTAIPGQTERSQVKTLKWLVADIIELSVELLTPSQGKEVLFDQLRELGWYGQAADNQQDRMSFDQFRSSMKSSPLKTEPITNSAIHSRLEQDRGTVNLGSNAKVIVGGMPWSEIKVKRKDPSWDKASFWKGLSAYDQNLMLKLIEEDQRSTQDAREAKKISLQN